VKSGLTTTFHPQDPIRAACGGAGRRLRGEKNWIFCKNPIFLSLKTPSNNETELSSYY